LLTKAALDPVAKIPEFKACAVHIARAQAGRPQGTVADIHPRAAEDAALSSEVS
jgi:hypothetical protein